jgi:hypothetical protein
MVETVEDINFQQSTKNGNFEDVGRQKSLE